MFSEMGISPIFYDKNRVSMDIVGKRFCYNVLQGEMASNR